MIYNFRSAYIFFCEVLTDPGWALCERHFSRPNRRCAFTREPLLNLHNRTLSAAFRPRYWEMQPMEHARSILSRSSYGCATNSDRPIRPEPTWRPRNNLRIMRTLRGARSERDFPPAWYPVNDWLRTAERGRDRLRNVLKNYPEMMPPK